MLPNSELNEALLSAHDELASESRGVLNVPKLASRIARCVSAEETSHNGVFDRIVKQVRACYDEDADGDPLSYYGPKWLRPWPIFRSLLMLPIALLRFSLLIVLFIFAVLSLGLLGLGLTIEEQPEEPPAKWRRVIFKCLAYIIGRVWLLIMGFHWIEKHPESRRLVSSKIAPVVVINHSTFMDALLLGALFQPLYAVSLALNWNYPVVKTCLNMTQSIAVHRGRGQEALDEMKRRSESETHFPRCIIFPEGCCTNRSRILRFKPGAFTLMKPVQPVVFDFPHWFFDPTWTRDGPTSPMLIIRSMFQIHNRVRVRVLDVVYPDEENGTVDDFSEQVRQNMTEALGVRSDTDWSLDDFMLRKNVDPDFPCRRFNVVMRRLKNASAEKQISVSTKSIGHLAALFARHSDNDLLVC
ncbi:MAG: hypothetical protein MHM6MM_000828 [Cercozoa sp. M6MM]